MGTAGPKMQHQRSVILQGRVTAVYHQQDTQTHMLETPMEGPILKTTTDDPAYPHDPYYDHYRRAYPDDPYYRHPDERRALLPHPG